MKNYLNFIKYSFLSVFSPDDYIKFKRNLKIVIICLVSFTVFMFLGVCFARSVSASEDVSFDSMVIDEMPKVKLNAGTPVSNATFTVDNNAFISDSLLDYFKGIFIKQVDFDSYFVFQHYQTSGNSSYRVYHLVLFNKSGQSGLPSNIVNCRDIRVYQAYLTGVGRSQYITETFDIATLNINGDYVTCYTNFPDIDDIPLWSDFWFFNNDLRWLKFIGCVVLFFVLLWFGMQFIKKRWYV